MSENRAETMEEIRARLAPKIAFDGVYRVGIWLDVDQWQGVAYTNDGRHGTRSTLTNPATGTNLFPTEEAAQAACDVANAHSGAARRAGVPSRATSATREAVSKPSSPPIPPDRLL